MDRRKLIGCLLATAAVTAVPPDHGYRVVRGWEVVAPIPASGRLVVTKVTREDSYILVFPPSEPMTITWSDGGSPDSWG